MCCGKGIRRAGEEEAGRSPQGILRKGRKLQCSGSEELHQDLVNFRPVYLPQSLWLGFTHHEPSARCAGFKKSALSPSLGFSSHPAETSMRLVSLVWQPGQNVTLWANQTFWKELPLDQQARAKHTVVRYSGSFLASRNHESE